MPEMGVGNGANHGRTRLPEFDTSLFVLLATVVIAGIAKGLSGFGSGLILAPVAGALYGPKAALVILVIIDSLPTIPVTIPALKVARWSEVIPVAVGLFALFPVGLWILTRGDEAVLRWFICLAILGCVVMLWTQWRYRGPRNPAVSFAVGGVAGVMSGIASIPGPPVIAYWMSAGLPAVLVRANLLTLFLIGEVISIGNLWVAGLFTRDTVVIGLVAIPVYFVGILTGWAMFSRGGEWLYRMATFVLVVMAAVLALPLFDTVFAALGRAVAG